MKNKFNKIIPLILIWSISFYVYGQSGTGGRNPVCSKVENDFNFYQKKQNEIRESDLSLCKNTRYNPNPYNEIKADPNPEIEKSQKKDKKAPEKCMNIAELQKEYDKSLAENVFIEGLEAVRLELLQSFENTLITLKIDHPKQKGEDKVNKWSDWAKNVDTQVQKLTNEAEPKIKKNQEKFETLNELSKFLIKRKEPDENEINIKDPTELFRRCEDQIKNFGFGLNSKNRENTKSDLTKICKDMDNNTFNVNSEPLKSFIASNPNYLDGKSPDVIKKTISSECGKLDGYFSDKNTSGDKICKIVLKNRKGNQSNNKELDNMIKGFFESYNRLDPKENNKMAATLLKETGYGDETQLAAINELHQEFKNISDLAKNLDQEVKKCVSEGTKCSFNTDNFKYAKDLNPNESSLKSIKAKIDKINSQKDLLLKKIAELKNPKNLNGTPEKEMVTQIENFLKNNIDGTITSFGKQLQEWENKVKGSSSHETKSNQYEINRTQEKIKAICNDLNTNQGEAQKYIFNCQNNTFAYKTCPPGKQLCANLRISELVLPKDKSSEELKSKLSELSESIQYLNFVEKGFSSDGYDKVSEMEANKKTIIDSCQQIKQKYIKSDSKYLSKVNCDTICNQNGCNYQILQNYFNGNFTKELTEEGKTWQKKLNEMPEFKKIDSLKSIQPQLIKDSVVITNNNPNYSKFATMYMESEKKDLTKKSPNILIDEDLVSKYTNIKKYELEKQSRVFNELCTKIFDDFYPKLKNIFDIDCKNGKGSIDICKDKKNNKLCDDTRKNLLEKYPEFNKLYSDLKIIPVQKSQLEKDLNALESKKTFKDKKELIYKKMLEDLNALLARFGKKCDIKIDPDIKDAATLTQANLMNCLRTYTSPNSKENYLEFVKNKNRERLDEIKKQIQNITKSDEFMFWEKTKMYHYTMYNEQCTSPQKMKIENFVNCEQAVKPDIVIKDYIINGSKVIGKMYQTYGDNKNKMISRHKNVEEFCNDVKNYVKGDKDSKTSADDFSLCSGYLSYLKSKDHNEKYVDSYDQNLNYRGQAEKPSNASAYLAFGSQAAVGTLSTYMNSRVADQQIQYAGYVASNNKQYQLNQQAAENYCFSLLAQGKPCTPNYFNPALPYGGFNFNGTYPMNGGIQTLPYNSPSYPYPSGVLIPSSASSFQFSTGQNIYYNPMTGVTNGYRVQN